MADLLRVSIMGDMPGGEKWSVNPVFGFTVPIAVSSDDAAAVATAINGVTLGGTIQGLNPGSVRLTGTRVEARNLAGELENVAEVARGTPLAFTGANQHPLQTSLVISLRTTDSTARGKGRMYWPATGVALASATHRFTPTTTSGVVTEFVTYLQNIRTAIRGVGGFTSASLVVWSRTTPKKSVVIQLRVGDVPDVQRRRRDKLVESYSTAPVTTF